MFIYDTRELEKYGVGQMQSSSFSSTLHKNHSKSALRPLKVLPEINSFKADRSFKEHQQSKEAPKKVSAFQMCVREDI